MAARDVADQSTDLENLRDDRRFLLGRPSARRRPAPVKISSRCADLAPVDTSLRSEIEMCRSLSTLRISPPTNPTKGPRATCRSPQRGERYAVCSSESIRLLRVQGSSPCAPTIEIKGLAQKLPVVMSLPQAPDYVSDNIGRISLSGLHAFVDLEVPRSSLGGGTIAKSKTYGSITTTDFTRRFCLGMQ